MTYWHMSCVKIYNLIATKLLLSDIVVTQLNRQWRFRWIGKVHLLEPVIILTSSKFAVFYDVIFCVMFCVITCSAPSIFDEIISGVMTHFSVTAVSIHVHWHQDDVTRIDLKKKALLNARAGVESKLINVQFPGTLNALHWQLHPLSTHKSVMVSVKTHWLLFMTS